ncbi:SDR family NAD(P)-dependent oxidoreductase [Lutimonas halocynthiae]|uniref:SDR family NAD(P)-dependent oxidoreductase n=1 Tax=Lutimonas halocynthiae TaxID=1446477 RepID=UPI0025B44337|nr:SDR family NAD(P)-dependent oxidoreductase [Lutimonas halocynthiae]MDN3642296.1 SDR family NAD(P)-dependent oxidoreductase [Lutimonas halocynthiae]
MSSKKIVVTGASRGIGLELVKKLAASGHQLLALSRNTASIDPILANREQVTFLETDITTGAGIKMVVGYVEENWDKVDIVIHNAGALLHKPFKETTSEDFLSIYQVNVFAVAELTRRLDPFLVGGSHVVAISSMGGIQGSMKFAGLSAYSSSKGAVITLMELLAEEYKEREVQFNALALGAVQTEMLKEAFPDYEAPISAEDMADYIGDFALKGNAVYNGKVLQVSSSTP